MRVSDKKVDAILCADVHLREDVPTCRTDDYWAAQERKIRFIRKLQEDHTTIDRPPVLCSGDLFDFWKPSPNLLRWAIDELPGMTMTPGQHDLPNHSLEHIDRSGIAVLRAAKKIAILENGSAGYSARQSFSVSGFPWGSRLVPFRVVDVLNSSPLPRKKIALVHALVSEKALWPGMEVLTPDAVMDALPEYVLIVTGDNHKPFVYRRDGRVLVNPGSMMRMTADQADMRPRVYLWYAETNEVEPVYLPIERDVVTRDHLVAQEEKDARLVAFVDRLKEGVEIGLSFERNLESFFSKNETPQEVRQVIYDAMEAKR